MMDASKYAPGYYPAPENEYRWVKKDHIGVPWICGMATRPWSYP